MLRRHELRPKNKFIRFYCMLCRLTTKHMNSYCCFSLEESIECAHTRLESRAIIFWNRSQLWDVNFASGYRHNGSYCKCRTKNRIRTIIMEYIGILDETHNEICMSIAVFLLSVVGLDNGKTNEITWRWNCNLEWCTLQWSHRYS